ncbi:MAG: prepilin peptidase [Patescibacteria group bacterium]|nr:prepilin peptidase [Patescibacteria group bacterium]
MIVVAIVLLGLCFGSFINALVWRVHEQAKEGDKKKPSKQYLKSLSVMHGRSMCPDCKHQLHTKDLLPVVSWASTRGRCRYCKKPISLQYPIVELSTVLLFLVSYLYWPSSIVGIEIIVFGLWLAVLTGLIALAVYDLRWMLLPNKILFPLFIPAGIIAVIRIVQHDKPSTAILMLIFSVLVSGGIFWLLFQLSSGKWIGGGDVKLGWLIGVLVLMPASSMLVIFIASLLGSLVSVPLLYSKKLARTSVIPFGPFLIIASIITVLFGSSILEYYRRTFLP